MLTYHSFRLLRQLLVLDSSRLLFDRSHEPNMGRQNKNDVPSRRQSCKVFTDTLALPQYSRRIQNNV